MAEYHKRKRDESAGYVLRGIVWSLRQGWRGTRWLGRGAWRATVWSIALAWTLTVWSVTLPWRTLKAIGRWWRGPEPYFESERERDIYRRIRLRFRRRNRLRLHGFIYLALNGFFWAQWFTMRNYLSAATWWSYIGLTFVLSVMLLYHYLSIRSAEAEENALAEALDRERWRADDAARYMRLSDDGELFEVVEEDEKRKHRRR